MKLRPELLQHPVIPPPLHGLAPRTVLGQKWWDATRKEAYAKNNDCCWACGIHKSESWYRKYLEAHESYTIDYDNQIVTLNEIVGLCHSCHNFIHIGRLISQYMQRNVSRNYVMNVLDWGVRVLGNAGLKPNATQGYHWLRLAKGFSSEQAANYILEKDLVRDKFTPGEWDNWRLIVDGNVYSGKSKAEWLGEFG